VDLGVHLPQLDLDGSRLSLGRLRATVDAARDLGYVAVGANDHLRFEPWWLDGPTALAAVLPWTGELELVTTIANPVLRGPVALARTMLALRRLAAGPVVAGVGPGSSRADYEAADVPFDDRWRRFDDSLSVLREELAGPEGVPVWVASWGSAAGLRRVARHGDGWLASAYNTDPERFGAALAALGGGLPHALVTMWTWVTERPEDALRVVHQVVGPMLGRDPAVLAGQLCVGSAGHCAELLQRYADAGCRRVHVWPVGSEPDQLRLLADRVLPRLSPPVSG
jgi:alkanesulfonate monooxygenase SsuD/methylene tetrahydromethanopterin reductase-like flavin-dependent oxidoreductase (luciferase family)